MPRQNAPTVDRQCLQKLALPVQQFPARGGFFACPRAGTYGVLCERHGGRGSGHGGRVSGTINGRAMVFTSEPQDIDVYDGDRWVPASMLGWRHENEGPCRIMVRFTGNSIAKTAWARLEHVRLPQRHPVRLPGAGPDDVGAPSPARDHPKTQPLPIGRSPEVREDEFERSSARAAPSRAGKPDPGNRTDHPRRRRTDAPPAGHMGELADAGAPESDTAGRHRAPSEVGRHRAGDPGFAPAGREPHAGRRFRDAGTCRDKGWTDRLGSSPSRESFENETPPHAAPELLTRPISVAGAVPQPRTRRLDDYTTF